MEKDILIHPTAVVDSGAQVGCGTRIWHFSHLMPHCQVGTGCNIGQNVFIDNGAVVGNGVKIQNNVSVYSGVVLEDEVFVGPSAVFTNVINPRSFIERKHEYKKTIIRRGATIGANATIVCGVEVGAYAMVGAGAVVTKNILPYALVYGTPARQHGWISEWGYALVFNEEGVANCPGSGTTYTLKEGLIQKK